MALKGIRVIELSGLAPAPFCGMLLSDFGAEVTVIDRTAENALDILGAGKRRLGINIRSNGGRDVLRRLCRVSDVLIDPYRPGVMEKLDLGPTTLLAENPRLIFARLTGFGQSGPVSDKAGHDINYVAMSGVLSFLGRKEGPPTPPVNLLADMAGGGLLCAFGIITALLERERSGLGQVVDSSMTEGCAYVASWLFRAQTRLPIAESPRGENLLDSGRFFYDTYETLDGKYMSVGALEPQFYRAFVETMGLPDLQQYGDTLVELENRQLVSATFANKTQAEWTKIFSQVDACVFPVLDWQTADRNPQNAERRSFVDRSRTDGDVVPTPSPKLSRTPAISSVERSRTTTTSLDVLKEIGLSDDAIKQLFEDGTIILPLESKL